MRYARTYADDAGETHCEDLEVALSPAVYVSGNPSVFLSAAAGATATVFCRIPADWSSDWHRSPHSQLAVAMSGEWEVTVSSGEVRRFQPGDLLRMDDTSGKGHCARTVSSGEVHLLFVWLS